MPDTGSHSRSLCLLGATGTIGAKALEVVDRFPGRLAPTGLYVYQRVDQLADLVRRYRPGLVAVGDPAAADRFDRSALPAGARFLAGPDAAAEMAADPSAGDIVLNAIVGSAGLRPSLSALERGAALALANKESIVLAGRLVMETARRTGGRVVPIDSEHSGLFQCLDGRRPDQVRRVLLTASGGPFRDRPAADLPGVTPREALRHPVWPMGERITIDSATLMNKGLEVLEAQWLFGLPLERIDVLVHRQSIVHALVEFTDGSVVAQLAAPDMILPVQYALSWPERWSPPLPPLDLAAIGRLDFEAPDTGRFPCLELAYRAGRAGGVVPAAMNAADEVAVEAFLSGLIGFTEIPALIEGAMADAAQLPGAEPPGVEAILAADLAARAWVRRALAAPRVS